MRTLLTSLAAALPLLLMPVLAQAQQDTQQGQQQTKDRQQITLEVAAPQGGEQFACGIPVTISHGRDLQLQKLNVIAKAYEGNVELSSTGIESDSRPLVQDSDQSRVEYAPAPLQFDLAEEDCEKITGLGVVFASCTFADGEQENCLERLRFQPERAGNVAFFVGEPKPPAR